MVPWIRLACMIVLPVEPSLFSPSAWRRIGNAIVRHIVPSAHGVHSFSTQAFRYGIATYLGILVSVGLVKQDSKSSAIN